MSAVSISRLTKRFGALPAVDSLDLEVPEGQIFGFLGLNGAGKTTTVRVLLDLLRPTSGTATILGHDCQTDGLRARSLVGYLPGELGSYTNMTGFDVLDLLGTLGAPRVDPAHRARIQDQLQLPNGLLRRKLREYSTGMKRKLGILQALQADPPLLILDEPTEGLDPLMQQTFYSMLIEAKRRGRTIFMSSHVLSEVDRICDRVGLLRKGKLVLLATVQEIRQLAPREVHVLFDADVPAPPRLGERFEVLGADPRLWSYNVIGDIGPLISLIARMPVKDLRVTEPRLEDVLLRYYREGEP
jgi:ABC-2 type transport system ATP-binding protein